MIKLAHFRERLEAERDRIAADVESTHDRILTNESPNVEQATYGNHQADQATEVFEDEKAIALENHQRGILEEVERALHRIEDGKFGICEDCGQEIAKARLEALPWAALCIDCQSRAEHRR